MPDTCPSAERGPTTCLIEHIPPERCRRTPEGYAITLSDGQEKTVPEDKALASEDGVHGYCHVHERLHVAA